MTKSKISIFFILHTLILLYFYTIDADDDVSISIDYLKPKWTISKYLTGSHFVYGHEPDALYRDNPEIIEWMKKARVGIIRWPGGTSVMSYHWNDLNGYSFKYQAKKLTGKEQCDSWNPECKLPKRDSTLFMDMDEFIKICRKVGAEPCIGINILSGKRFKRQQDSYNEAREQIKYCIKKGYNVKFWYIGNEAYAKGFSPKSYATALDTYARILKKADPDIIIIGDWKYGPESKKRFEQVLNLVKFSKELDLLEMHEKWGNPWGVKSGNTIKDWMAESPYLYNGALTNYTNKLLNFAKNIKKEKLRIGYNEWGLGNIKGDKSTPHMIGLICADYLIEIFRAPITTACYWNLNSGTKNTRIFNVNKDGSVTMNPIRHPFTIVSKAMGEDLLELKSSNPEIYGFASRSKDSIQLFILNKSKKSVNLKIMLSGCKLGKIIESEIYETPGVINNKLLTDKTPDIPPFSFSRFKYKVSDK